MLSAFSSCLCVTPIRVAYAFVSSEDCVCLFSPLVCVLAYLLASGATCVVYLGLAI